MEGSQEKKESKRVARIKLVDYGLHITDSMGRDIYLFSTNDSGLAALGIGKKDAYEDFGKGVIFIYESDKDEEFPTRRDS